MSIINERHAKRKLCDNNPTYDLLYGSFITCVEMYLIVATAVYTNMFILSVLDFKKAFQGAECHY